MTGRSFVRAVLIALASFQAAFPAFSQTEGVSQPEKEKYGMCMALTASDADAAYDLAKTWVATGGGLPAMHCSAIALFRLARFTEAGQVFEDMAVQTPTDNPELLARIYGQGGNAWLSANYALRAYDLFTAGLKTLSSTSPERIELLVDRARALGLAEDYKGAIKDLEVANKAMPDRLDILTLKASAHRKLHEFEPAKALLEQALKLSPDHPEALLERGNLRFTLNDGAGARADWIRFLALYPDQPEAEAVRRNLERLDVRVEDFGQGQN